MIKRKRTDSFNHLENAVAKLLKTQRVTHEKEMEKFRCECTLSVLKFIADHELLGRLIKFPQLVEKFRGAKNEYGELFISTCTAVRKDKICGKITHGDSTMCIEHVEIQNIEPKNN